MCVTVPNALLMIPSCFLFSVEEDSVAFVDLLLTDRHGLPSELAG